VIEEFLYPAMEDYRIDIRLSEGPKAQTITMPIERFTLIGATTRFGMLTAPMRARFGIEQRLNYYAAEDLELIVRRTADVLKVEIELTGAREIARLLERGTRRRADVDAQLARDELGERGLTQPRRPIEDGMVEGLRTRERGVDGEPEVVLDLLLSNELLEPLRT
jgi:Holliday junction DNA helicase RuvB